MKRWQTRGEVQDSDEDEIGLDIETKNLQHLSKRLKSLNELADNNIQDENQAPATQRQDTTLVGEKDPDEAQHHDERTSATGAALSSPVHAATDIAARSQTVTQDDDNEPGWTVQTNARTYGRLQGASRTHAAVENGLIPVVTQAEQTAANTAGLDTTYDIPSSSLLPESSIVPSAINDPLPPSPGLNGLPITQSQDDLMSRASSPLSELSNPPNSPPEFFNLFDSSHAPFQSGVGLASTASRTDYLDTLDDHALPPALLTQGARRSLRARQEKQLHPYMYDKAQYQRQCRERGLRPVRLLEQTAHETQDASLDQDNAEVTSSATRPSSSSSSLIGIMSSGIPFEDASHTNPATVSMHQTEDDLPDIDRLLQRRAIPGRLQSRKRQKLAHKPNRTHNHGEQEDPFSVPPSPPPSSKESASASVKARQGFRIPRGLSPLPLPTPQISSDIRPLQEGTNMPLSDEDTPPRTLRRLARVRSVVTVGSDPSSESESSLENDQKLLSRERRRIRGVLPASWLNIDRKTNAKPHDVSIETAGRESSGTQSAPQKGVARKIYKRSTSHLGTNVLEISDGDELSESEKSTPTAAHRMPSMSQMNSIAAHDDDQNLDNMELDWFDPMLAGASRAGKTPGGHAKRRPRMTKASNRQSRPDFSEERNALRRSYGSKAPRQKATSNMRAETRKRAPALGILDAPKVDSQLGHIQPQFVRLAARQARRGTNHGRHSPSSKVIRLATHEETEQANATLEDWRRGVIPLRSLLENHQEKDSQNDYGKDAVSNPRTPLMHAISHARNPQKSPMPPRPRISPAPAPRQSRISGSRLLSARHGHIRQHRQPANSNFASHHERNLVPNRPMAPAIRYRGAQLETQESTYMQQSRSAAFQRRMQCLTESVAQKSETSAAAGLPMARFLQESHTSTQRHRSPPLVQFQQEHNPPSGPVSAPLPHRPRKRRTQRLDIDTRQYRQPSEPLPDANAFQHPETVPSVNSGLVLQGLGPSGTRYATDFDIRPLPMSTFFHENTFIGSGDLASALAMADRDMDQGSGSLRIYINGDMHEWSAWSEQVSDAMASIPSSISDALNGVQGTQSSERDGEMSAVKLNIEHMLRSTIRYLSSCLYFLDAIDRKLCCERLDQLAQEMIELTEQTEIWAADFRSLIRPILSSILIIARQTEILGNNPVVPVATRAGLYDRTARIASALASHLVPGHLGELRAEYEQQRVLSARELGIRKDDSIMGAIVILHQCMCSDNTSRVSFWGIIGKALNIDIANVQASSEMDAAWYSIFSMLPVLDFGATGILESRTSDSSQTGWQLPTQLVERCLELYTATSAVRGSSINDYVRAALTRCSNLFSRWEWWRCETLLSTVYDFFARRSLALLHHEDGHGSPEFLENLTCIEDDSLEARADDRSFSIFLKMLVASLRTWRRHGIYTDKKIGGIAWRIIPNHARIYRKDSEVQQTDLDALRNHFDLLCSLYFASPPLYRLRVDLLRNLVDHSTSHREACRISVRAWSRLASFQMSTNESMDKLEPFVEWFKDMLQTTVAQYRLARVEAEQQYADAKASGTVSLNNDILEKTIASNQRQLAATIVDVLAAYRRALKSASRTDVARFLMTGCEPWKAVDSFHPSERRLKSAFEEILETLKTTIDMQHRFHTKPDSATQDEDSQDYGDISILHEFATGEAVDDNDKDQDLVSLMHDPFARLVSDAFGSETSPDDSLLTKVLDTWIQLAKHMVCNGLRSWSNFLVDYNAGAWSQLRDTVQHRKFTPYVMAAILDADPSAFEALKSTFLGTWLKSLVERSSTLKYQHLLTQALLNASYYEPILQNLPFSKTSEVIRYHVNLQELKQRRLALISSVLSNMLEHYNQTMLDDPRSLPDLGRSYSELAQQVMKAMKANYQELQQNLEGDVANANLRGDYVDFVQEVVAFLQQYSIEGVYTVDRFFLDSSAFPLPADDPTYVVGRLRKHVPRLAEAKTRKQLATFLHNISERAAFDQQQAYLIDQLHRSMSGTTDLGNMYAPSLRHVLLTSIIPAYIESAIGDDFTWILAAPMIMASARSVADLLYDTDLSSEDSIAASTEQMASLLGAAHKALAQLHANMEVLKSAHVLFSVRHIFSLCEATVVFANYIWRSAGRAELVLQQIKTLQRQASTIEEFLIGSEDLFGPIIEDDEMKQVDSYRWPDTYAFTARHIQQSVSDDWSSTNDRYFVKHGNASREVVVQLDRYEEERGRTLDAIAAFRSICCRQNRRGMRARKGRGAATSASGLDDLLV